ncbi:MAG: hypothetical protein R3B92_00655 [Patescibacteria group bacterium]
MSLRGVSRSKKEYSFRKRISVYLIRFLDSVFGAFVYSLIVLFALYFAFLRIDSYAFNAGQNASAALEVSGLRFGGDVTGNALNLKLKDKIVSANSLADIINYTGELNILGSLKINGVDITTLLNPSSPFGNTITNTHTNSALESIGAYISSISSNGGIDVSNNNGDVTLELKAGDGLRQEANGLKIKLASLSTSSTESASGLEISSSGLSILSGCSTDQGLIWNGSKWNCGDIGSGGSGDITAVGSMTSGATFADSTADDDWLGLGSSAGRIEFDDQATDEVNILDASFNVGTTAQFSVSSSGNLASIRGVSYTWPSSQASSSGYVLSNDGSGNLSWTAASGGSLGGSGVQNGVAYWSSSSALTSEASVFYWDASNDRLGIGTSAPTQALDITGDLRVRGDDLYMGTNTSGYVLVADGTNFNPVALSGDISINSSGATTVASITCTDCLGASEITDIYLLNSGDAGSGTYTFSSGSVTVDNILLDANTIAATNDSGVYIVDNAGNGVFVEDGGNVGIGTTTPATDIGGVSARLDVAAPNSNWGYAAIFRADSSGRGLGLTSSNFAYSTNSGGILVQNAFDTYTNFQQYKNGQSAYGDILLQGLGGNLGIGTTSPTAKLSVGATSQFTVNLNGNLTRINDVAYSWPSSQGASSTVLTNNGSGTLTWTTPTTGTVTGSGTQNYVPYWGTSTSLSDSGLYWSGSTLGIGTTNPSQELTVIGEALYVADSAAQAPAQYAIHGATNSNNRFYIGYNTSANYGALQAITEGSTVRPISLNPAGGNVGVGTTNPTQELDVAGDIMLSGNGGTNALYFGGSTSNSLSWTGSNLQVNTTGGFQVFDNTLLLSGNSLTIYDSGNTDYLTLSHDGTDFNLDATNTTDINLTGANLAIDATKRLYFDGGSNTYITETAADTLDIYTGGTFVARVDSSQQINVGNTSLGAKFGVQQNSTETLGIDAVPASKTVYYANPSADSAAVFSGQYNIIYAQGANNFTNTVQSVYNIAQHAGTGTVANLTGFTNVAWTTGTSNATSASGTISGITVADTSTITNAYGFLARTPSGTGTITNSYGLYLQDPTNTSGTTTNAYGLFIATPSAADTLTYALYSQGGDNYFGGDVGVGAAPASAKVDITSTSEQLRLKYDASNYSAFTVNSSGNLGVVPSGGRFGINTNSPNAAFDLYANPSSATPFQIVNTANSNRVMLQFSTISNNGFLRLYDSDQTLTTNIQSSGGASYMLNSSLGLGTTDPQNTLHINGSFRLDGAGTLNNSYFTVSNSGATRSTRIYGTGSVHTGIGFLNPGTAHAGIRSLGSYMQFMSASASDTNPDSWTATPLMHLDFSSAYVGIGLTNPQARLHVAGDIRIPANSKFYFEDSGTNNAIYRDSANGNAVFTSPADFVFASGGAATDYVRVKNSTGYVGVGTTSPSVLLDVNGQFRAANATNAWSVDLGQTSPNTGAVLTASGYAVQSGIASFTNVNGGSVILARYNANVDNQFTGTSIESGNQSTVGITNTFNPTDLVNPNVHNMLLMDPTLDTAVGTTNTFRGIYYNPTLTSVSGTTHIAYQNTTGDVLLGTTSGSVGIGTESPNYKLDISDNSANFVASFFNDGNASSRQGILVQACSDTNPAASCNFLEFRDGDGTAVGAIEGNGLGGVSINMSGADYAELFDGDRSTVATGSIIGFAYDGSKVGPATAGTPILGVLSVAHATLGNWFDGWENSTQHIPVGLLGQIPVKVTGLNGDIKVGDPIAVDPSVAGRGIKAASSGYIVGYALEDSKSNLNTDEDVIKVYVSPTYYTQPQESVVAQNTSIAGASTMINDLKDLLDSLVLKTAVVDDLTVTTLEGNLNVLGSVTVTDLYATNSVNLGTLSLSGTANALNVEGKPCGEDSELCSSQTLYLQKNLAGNIDFFDSAIVFKPNGDITVEGTINVGSIAISGNSVGTATIDSGDTEVIVQTSAVSKDSKIFLTPVSNVVPVTYKDKKEDEFTIEIAEPIEDSLDIDWWVVN